jgi:hypothetical protein
MPNMQTPNGVGIKISTKSSHIKNTDYHMNMWTQSQAFKWVPDLKFKQFHSSPLYIQRDCFDPDLFFLRYNPSQIE